MKIQRLIIKNIASIEAAEIEFDRGPLADEPLFLITGDTGTGKTTILNAICLALYDKVPALGNIGTSEEDRDGIQTNNTRQLMRKGTGHCFVELTFIGNDDKRYLAKWETQRAHKKVKGKIQATTRQLTVDNNTYTAKREIDQLITRAVGLTFDQFTRTTMLAQGQFATFMKAEDKNKSDILEKLTGTEIYTRIGKKVFELYKAKEQEYDLLDAQIKGANLLSEEQKADYKAKVKALAESLVGIDARLKTLDTQLTWLRQHIDLNKQLSNKQEEKKSAEERVASEENRQRVAKIKLWDETVEIRRLRAELAKAKSEMAALSSRMQNLSGEKWHTILDGIKWLETEQGRISSQINKLKAEVESQSVFSTVFDNAQSIDEKAKSVAKSLNTRDVHQKKLKQLKIDLDKSITDEMPLKEALEKAESDYKTKLSDYEKKEGEMKAYDMTQISKDLTNIVNRLTSTQSAIAAIKEYNKCLSANNEAQKAYKEVSDELSSTNDELEGEKAKRPDAQKRSELADAYLQGQMELKDHILSLREKFAETHVCPLCGNTDAKLNTDEAIDEKLADAKKAAEDAKRSLEELNNHISQLEASIKVMKKNVSKLKTAASEAKSALDKAEENAAKLTADYKSEDCLKNLIAKQTDLENEKKTISEKFNLANDLQSQLNASRKERDNSLDVKHKAEKKLEQQQQKTSQLKASIANEESIIDTAVQDANDIIDEMLKFTVCDDKDENQKFADMLKANTGYDTISIDSISVVAPYIISLANKYKNDKDTLTESERKASELSHRISEVKTDVKALTERFLSEYEPVAKECQNLEDEIRQINTDVNTLDGEIKGAQSKIDSTERSVNEWFTTSEITREEVDEISEASEQDIAEARAEVKAADDALVKTNHEIGVIEAQIKTHDATKPEIEDNATVESLSSERDKADSEKNAATAERSRYETQLHNDEINAKAQADNTKRLAVLAKEKNNWAILNKNFGASDGSLFKKVAQSYLLRLLLDKTNDYLNLLSRRYSLICDYGSLTINVIDANQGGVIRNVGLLSGGESFVVSLALALGLSAISKEKINVDTLFIDEGFGSLDKDILDTVITVLDRLHSAGGRRIGIISHIQDLKDRIPTQICLVRTGPSTSKVVISY